MRARTLSQIAAAVVLAGCAGQPTLEGKRELGQACAVRPCECLSNTVPFFLVRERTPVQWRENGDAYCPEGFKLVLRDEP